MKNQFGLNCIRLLFGISLCLGISKVQGNSGLQINNQEFGPVKQFGLSSSSYRIGLIRIGANIEGSASSSGYKLQLIPWRPINAAPAIINQPISLAVSAGLTATFTVSVTGNAPLSYQWKVGGVNVSTGNGANTSTYTTPITTSLDNGKIYTCLISNPQGSVTTNPVTLTVIGGLVAPLQFVPNGSSYTTRINVTISTLSPNADLHYTIDGSTPTVSSPNVANNGTVVIERGKALKAIGFAPGLAPSPILSATYQITGMLAAGLNHSLTLRSDGTVYAFGANNFGQLGDGSLSDRDSAVTVPNLSNILAIAAGSNHSLALKNDGTVWSWGANASGQLGDSTLVQKNTPILVSRLSNIIAIAAGQNHSLALKSDGTVWSWGTNTNGQLGDGTIVSKISPVQVTGLTGIVVIATGVEGNHNLALKNDGTVWSWGNNINGQLGDNTTANKSTVRQIAGFNNVVAIAAAGNHSLGLKNDGTVWSWGLNTSGELGDNTITQRLTPVVITGLTGVNFITAGVSHNLAVQTTGSVWAFGLNSSGQIGNGNTLNQLSPVQIAGINNPLFVAAGGSHSLAILSDGSVDAWGNNSNGQLGNALRYRRFSVANIGAATKVSAGAYHSLSLLPDSTLRSWGNNPNGQLGNSNLINQLTPVIPSGVTGISQMIGGNDHTLALLVGGTLKTWGLNTSGQLGNGTNTSSSIAVAVSTLTNVQAIAAGSFHSLALKSDGTVWAWGSNSNGQLGDGTLSARNTPQQILSLSGITAIATGNYFSLALKNDGTVWAWGQNAGGQLGDNSTVDKLIPVQVQNLTSVNLVAAGGYHGLARKSDGTVWAWGNNGAGQLGDGTLFQRQIPVLIAGLTNVTVLAGGSDFSLALKSDQSVWAWGGNTYGQLGNQSTLNSLSPLSLSGLSANSIAAGARHSLAARVGSVLAWGDNTYGQWGIGTDLHQPTPAVVKNQRLVFWDDPDGDGLPTWQEILLGINPDKFDTDGDGLPDGWEVTNGLNPLINNAAQDPDGDGLTNLLEFQNNTNPNDYFNGTLPLATIAGGNNQTSDPNLVLPIPLSVLVKNVSNQPLANAPVNFSVASVGGTISNASNGSFTSSLQVKTNASGNAMVYFKQPSIPNTTSNIYATVTSGSNVLNVAFSAITNASSNNPDIPFWSSGSHLSVSDIHSSSITISWTAADDDSGVSQYRIYRKGIFIDSVPGNQLRYTDVGLLINTAYPYKIEAGDLRGNHSHSGPSNTFSTANDLPPHPEVVAPPLNNTVATTLFASASFLFADSNAIQTGMTSGIINPVHAAVIRGIVKDTAGNPLSGVTVSVLKGRDFGSTITRDNGEYDLMLNGGGFMVIKYSKSNYLPAQRQIDVPWRDYAIAPEIMLVQLDTAHKVISLDTTSSMQVMRASSVTDSNGTRRATLLFPAYTTAQKVFPDGSTQALSSMTVRATEFTIGSNGPQKMPASLPPTSAYTYAVNFSVDSALDEGTSIHFNHPVYSYMEDFVGIPVGWHVPSGYYDLKKGQWIPSPDGRVIKIHGINGGIASLDVNGSGSVADSATLDSLGVTLAELQSLATLYSAGDSLWRVPIYHFSVYDFNYARGSYKKAPDPDLPDGDEDPYTNEKECKTGSIIDCQNQILGESFPLVGTPFSLNYSSDRHPGRKEGYILNIPLTTDYPPTDLQIGSLTINIAGRTFHITFYPFPNQTYHFEWDGLNAYGQRAQGRQRVTYTVGYGYHGIYEYPSDAKVSFALSQYIGDSMIFTPPPSMYFFFKERTKTTFLGSWNNINEGLGGWDLDIHHQYDVSAKTLYMGNGKRLEAEDLRIGKGVFTTAGNGTGGSLLGDIGDGGKAIYARVNRPIKIDFAMDGTLYICQYGGYPVRKVNPNGIISTIAGTDGATDVRAGLDGSLYIVINNQIFKINANDNLSLVAGTGENGFSGDEGLATAAKLNSEPKIAIGPDGSLYIADRGNFRIRKVGLDGIIHTIAGNGSYTFVTDSVSALDASFSPSDIDIDPSGNIFISDGTNNLILKISPDGFLIRFAGKSSGGYTQDGFLAKETRIYYPSGIRVGREPNGQVIYFISGPLTKKINVKEIVSTVAGGGKYEIGELNGKFIYKVHEGDVPTSQYFDYPQGLAIDKNETVYIADYNLDRVLSLKSYLPLFANEAINISSEDGSEIYSFDTFGKHLRTKNALSGAVLYSFVYDSANGYLSAIRDANGNETILERDNDGKITNLISPYGRITNVSLDTKGCISNIINPAGEMKSFVYDSLGLMQSYTDPRNNAHIFTYNSLGRLVRDDDPSGGYKTLSKTKDGSGSINTVTTSLGKSDTYKIQKFANGENQKLNFDPAGLLTKTKFMLGGATALTTADSVIVRTVIAPDPRFGLIASFPESTIVTLPSGKKSITTRKIQVELADPGDPFSIQSIFDTVKVNGRRYTSKYDSATQTFASRTPEGRRDTTTIDSLGRVVKKSVSGLHPVSYTYDDRGRIHIIAQDTGATARTKTLAYNSAGYLSQLTDEEGRLYKYEYDLAGRVTKQILPDNREILATYDSSGNIKSLKPAGKPEHSFAYTPIDLDSNYAPPTLGAGNWSTGKNYNLDKQLLNINRADSNQIHFEYDTTGRLVELQIPNGSLRYHYNIKGHLDSVWSASNVATAYGYDGGLKTSETWSKGIYGNVSYEYDYYDISLLKYQYLNGSYIYFGYDYDNLLISIGNYTSGYMALTHNPQNGLLTKTTLNNIVDTLTYNGFGEVTQYLAKKSTDTLYRTQYKRDKLGRITEKKETVQAITHTYNYQYDVAGRLSQVSLDSTVQAKYVYDSNSNRLKRIIPGDTLVGIYDDQDRLTKYDGVNYTYNKHGDLVKKIAGSDTTRYTYDVLGNLLKVILPTGNSLEYIIDGQNRRVGKKVNGTLTQGFLYQGQLNPVAELSDSNTVVARFIYGTKSNVPDQMIKGGVTYRIISDHLGSVRLVVNSSTGSVAQRMDYDEFGNVTYDGNPGFQPFGFAGGLYDNDTKLERFGARDYNAVTGRFTNKDPIRFRGGLNQYAYVGNNPVNHIDRTGLQEEDESEDDIAESWETPKLEVEDDAKYKEGEGGLSDALPERDPNRFDEDQNAIIQLAKNAKRNGCGLTKEEGKTMEDWAKEFNLKFRGPESHPDRTYTAPHYHVGPVNHVPALD